MSLASNRSSRISVTSLLFALGLMCGPALVAAPSVAKVTAVVDGDTIRVLVEGAAAGADGRPVTLRLRGVDCPERGQAYGTRARQFTNKLAYKARVTFTVTDRDRNGRLVADVVLPDGRNLTEEIVRAGFGWWFRRYAAADTRLRTLEEEARKAGRGLWADSNPVAPWDWRAARRPAAAAAAAGR